MCWSQRLSRTLRLALAALAALMICTVAPNDTAAAPEVVPNDAAKQTRPDLMLTTHPWDSPRRTVQVGDQVSIYVWASTKNGIGGKATIRIVLPMGFTNATLTGITDLEECERFGPDPSLGGTLVRCYGVINSGEGISAVVIHANAPTTIGTYEIVGAIYSTGAKDHDESNNGDSVVVTTIPKNGVQTSPNPRTSAPGVGVETRPNPNTKGPKTVEVKPNPNVRK